MEDSVLRILLERPPVFPDEVASLNPAEVSAGLKEWLDIVGSTDPLDDEFVVDGGRNLSHAPCQPGQLSRVVLDWYRESAGTERAEIAAYFLEGLWFGPAHVDEETVRVLDEWFVCAPAESELAHALVFALYGAVCKLPRDEPLSRQVRGHSSRARRSASARRPRGDSNHAGEPARLTSMITSRSGFRSASRSANARAGLGVRCVSEHD